MNFGEFTCEMDDISLAESMNSFIVSETSALTEENMCVDSEAVETILNLGKRNRRPPKRYGEVVTDIEMNSDGEDNMDDTNDDSDFNYESDSDSGSVSDSEEEMKVSEAELHDIKKDFGTIINTSKLSRDDEIARWQKRFEILMSYFDQLSQEDRQYLNNNFIMPSEITLPFVYELQENRRFMQIIEYVYKLYEVEDDELEIDL